MSLKKALRQELAKQAAAKLQKLCSEEAANDKPPAIRK